MIRNTRIEKCGGHWGSGIVLAAKTHQEFFQNIDDLIWRMCVSYGKLNGIKKTFELPIPRCDGNIITVGYGSNKILIISLDSRQGYHQISVRHVNR